MICCCFVFVVVVFFVFCFVLFLFFVFSVPFAGVFEQLWWFTPLTHRIGVNRNLLTIDVRGSKIARNSRATNGNRKLCFERFFYLRSSIISSFSIAAYPMCAKGFVVFLLIYKFWFTIIKGCFWDHGHV